MSSPTSSPRGLVVAALRGSSAKTMISLSLVTALRRRGLVLGACKKGPDFIDPGWLTAAGGRPCRNLDVFLMGETVVRETLVEASRDLDFMLVEGNRGLFDGLDGRGSYSTAALAKLLGLPVLLVLDCTKCTGTIAALVRGCRAHDPELQLAGVILNKVAGKRHEAVLREALGFIEAIPVLGVLPVLDQALVGERYLGLHPAAEREDAAMFLDRLAEVGERYFELETMLSVASPINLPPQLGSETFRSSADPVRIGVVRDRAFHFYYPENLEQLEAGGAELIFLDALTDKRLPELDTLYLGGGFPEVHAERLAANRDFLVEVREAAEAGLPIYAECGGAIFLGRSVLVEGRRHELCSVLDLDFQVFEKPRGHGYVEAVVDAPNPFFPMGMSLRGHEFHYSAAANIVHPTAYRLDRGQGFGARRDAVVRYQVLASYTHLHARATQDWAACLLERARNHRVERDGSS